MDKSMTKTKNVPAKKTDTPKRRRGRPPKYPDVWGKPCSPQLTGKVNQPIAKSPDSTTADQPVNQSANAVHQGQTSYPESPPRLDAIDQNTVHSDSDSVQFMGSVNMCDHDKTRKRQQGRPRVGPTIKKTPNDSYDYVETSQGAMVVTEEELLRMYYETGGRDVKNFPMWVQDTYQGRAHPVKFARLQSADDSESLAKPAVVIVENERQTCQVSSPTPVIIRPLNITPSNVPLQQCHQHISPPPFQSQQNHCNLPSKRTCDRNMSPVPPAAHKYGVFKPLVKNIDVALDLSMSTSEMKNFLDTHTNKSTGPVCHHKNIETWTVDEVCQFVSEVANCESYAQVFKEHVIDGQLLLELSENQMMTHLHMKLGPTMNLRRAIKAREMY